MLVFVVLSILSYPEKLKNNDARIERIQDGDMTVEIMGSTPYEYDFRDVENVLVGETVGLSWGDLLSRYKYWRTYEGEIVYDDALELSLEPVDAGMHQVHLIQASAYGPVKITVQRFAASLPGEIGTNATQNATAFNNTQGVIVSDDHEFIMYRTWYHVLHAFLGLLIVGCVIPFNLVVIRLFPLPFRTRKIIHGTSQTFALATLTVGVVILWSQIGLYLTLDMLRSTHVVLGFAIIFGSPVAIVVSRLPRWKVRWHKPVGRVVILGMVCNAFLGIVLYSDSIVLILGSILFTFTSYTTWLTYKVGQKDTNVSESAHDSVLTSSGSKIRSQIMIAGEDVDISADKKIVAFLK